MGKRKKGGVRGGSAARAEGGRGPGPADAAVEVATEAAATPAPGLGVDEGDGRVATAAWGGLASPSTAGTVYYGEGEAETGAERKGEAGTGSVATGRGARSGPGKSRMGPRGGPHTPPALVWGSEDDVFSPPPPSPPRSPFGGAEEAGNPDQPLLGRGARGGAVRTVESEDDPGRAGRTNALSESRWRFGALALASLASVGSYYCYDNPAALAGPLRLALGLRSATGFNALYTVYSAPNVILPFFGGVLVDSLGTGASQAAFLMAVTAGQCLFASSVAMPEGQGYSRALLGRTVFGLGGENLAVVQSTILAHWFQGKEMALALGTAITFARVGSVLNDWVSPWIYDTAMGTDSYGAAVYFATSGLLLAGDLQPDSSGMLPWAVTETGGLDIPPPASDASPPTTDSDRLAPSSLPPPHTMPPVPPGANVGDVRHAVGAALWAGLGLCLTGLLCAGLLVILERHVLKRAHGSRDAMTLAEAGGAYAPLPGSAEDALSTERSQIAENGEGGDRGEAEHGDDSDGEGEASSSFFDSSFPPAFWVLCASCCLFYGALMPFNNICGLMLQEEYGYSEELADRMMSVPFALAALTMPLVGSAIDRVGRRATLCTAAGITLFMGHLMLANMAAPLVPLSLVGVAYTLYAASVWPTVALVVPPHVRGTAYGIIVAWQNAGLATTPIGVGKIHDSYGSYVAVEYFLAALAFVSATLGGILLLMDTIILGGKIEARA